MKRLLFIITIVLVSVVACEKGDVQIYESNNGVYFQLYPQWNNLNDTLIYSFVKNYLNEDIINIRVNLQGVGQNYDRKFKLKVNEEGTTAVEGVDYAPLEDFYIISANTFYTEVPLYLKRTDILKTKDLLITFYLEATEDLGIGLNTRQNAVIKYTDRLMKPVYWDGFNTTWGEWSQVKQLITEELCDFEFPETRDEALTEPLYSKFIASGKFMSKWFADNIVYDENNNRIQPWM